MKKTFKLKLDTDFTIDFTKWGLSDAQQRGGLETKKLLIKEFLDENGVDDFEISEKNNTSLFEAMAIVVKEQNEELRVES